MKGYLRLLLVAVAGMVVGSAVTLSYAQSSALDPARVAPHIFEVVLENEEVRVLRVTDRNGETQPLHSHPGRVIVRLSPCAWIVAEDDGSTRMESYKFGDVYWAPPLTHGGRTSNVVEECRSVEIEIKAPSVI
ncbi:MAG: hypothetical protein GXP15_03300 [Gammaproteobacteria bacterium]|nr:hypothetical protein [Gammaproteobacteria bacterium]